MKTTKHIAALLAALVLALSLTACGQTAAKDDPMNPAIPVADGAEIGEGSKTFTTEVADQDGKAVTFTVHTDEKTVGDALQKLHVVAGEASSYGLYVKTVNGMTADYDKDGVYWAFYIDGEYAMTGVDATNITRRRAVCLPDGEGELSACAKRLKDSSCGGCLFFL